MADVNDALADLGLDLEAPAPELPNDAEVSAEKKPSKPRVEVKIGEIVYGEDEELPGIERSGPGVDRESKYNFDELAEPVEFTRADGSKGWKYKTFVVGLLEGVDKDALLRSVNSATTAANKKAEEAKNGKYFVTRSVIENDKFVGVKVFRIDDTTGKVTARAAKAAK